MATHLARPYRSRRVEAPPRLDVTSKSGLSILDRRDDDRFRRKRPFAVRGVVWFVAAYWLAVLVAWRLQFHPSFEVGTDGVLTRERSGTKFTPHAAIEDIRRFLQDRYGTIGQTDLLQSAELARTTISNETLAKRLVERAGSDASYRQAGFPADDLWSILEDGRAFPGARIAAAKLLADHDSSAKRLRDVAELTADPELRHELRTIATARAT